VGVIPTCVYTLQWLPRTRRIGASQSSLLCPTRLSHHWDRGAKKWQASTFLRVYQEGTNAWEKWQACTFGHSQAHPWLGNCHPKGSSPIRQLSPQGSSPVRQLPSERFIPNRATAKLIPNRTTTFRKVHSRLGYYQFVCVARRKTPLENYSANTYLWVPKAHPQLGSCHCPTEDSFPIE